MYYNNYGRKNEIELNKNMYGIEHYADYLLRFVDADLVGNDRVISERNFFPTSTFTEIVNERVELTPTEFSITGKEGDFLRKNLWEYSNIQSFLPMTYKEQEQSGDSFVRIRVHMDEDTEVFYNFGLTQLNSEDCKVFIDPSTNKMIMFINEYELIVDSEEGDGTVTQQIKETYTMDSIVVESVTPVASKLKRDKKNKQTIPNPFKEYGMMPILWFKGYSKKDTYYSQAPSSVLIESQFQIDYLNTDIENLTHKHVFPITELRKAMKKYNDVYIGAGTFWNSRGEEELKIHTSDLHLNELGLRLADKIDTMYKLGGLVPISNRKDLAGSSSSKITKFASKEFIELTKTRLGHIKVELKNLVKLFLAINSKTFTDENVLSPMDVLQIDKEETLKVVAMELAMGLTDDELIWRQYYPELSDEDKERIRKAFKERQVDANSDILNVDNKVKIAGNKEQNASSREGKESLIGKEV